VKSLVQIIAELPPERRAKLLDRVEYLQREIRDPTGYWLTERQLEGVCLFGPLIVFGAVLLAMLIYFP